MAVFRCLAAPTTSGGANPSNLEAWWESRTQKLAGMIPPSTRVIEFGAGKRA